MMVRKMEEGMSRFDAATFAYTSTAMPMLTGTLITVAGFPIGLATARPVFAVLRQCAGPDHFLGGGRRLHALHRLRLAQGQAARA
jgi:hypothetical protein